MTRNRPDPTGLDKAHECRQRADPEEITYEAMTKLSSSSPGPTWDG